jgi:hypothetical protein
MRFRSAGVQLRISHCTHNLVVFGDGIGDDFARLTCYEIFNRRARLHGTVNAHERMFVAAGRITE